MKKKVICLLAMALFMNIGIFKVVSAEMSVEEQTKNINTILTNLDKMSGSDDYQAMSNILTEAIKKNPKASNLDKANSLLDMCKKMIEMSKSAVLVKLNLMNSKNQNVVPKITYCVLLKDDKTIAKHMNDIKSADLKKQFDLLNLFIDYFTDDNNANKLVVKINDPDKEPDLWGRFYNIPPGNYFIYVLGSFENKSGMVLWLLPLTKKDNEKSTVELNRGNQLLKDGENFLK